MWWLWFAIGMFVGAFLGIFAIALVSISQGIEYPECDVEEKV